MMYQTFFLSVLVTGPGLVAALSSTNQVKDHSVLPEKVHPKMAELQNEIAALINQIVALGREGSPMDTSNISNCGFKNNNINAQIHLANQNTMKTGQDFLPQRPQHPHRERFRIVVCNLKFKILFR